MYRADVGETQVDFKFDQPGVVVNRGNLYVGAHKLDESSVHDGESSVSRELPDGPPFRVELGSGFVGQLEQVELILGDERSRSRVE